LESAGLGVSIAETYEKLYNIYSKRRFRKEVEYWLSQYSSSYTKLFRSNMLTINLFLGIESLYT